MGAQQAHGEKRVCKYYCLKTPNDPSEEEGPRGGVVKSGSHKDDWQPSIDSQHGSSK